MNPLLLRYLPYITAAVALLGLGYWLGGLRPAALLAEQRLLHETQIATWERLRADANSKALEKQQALQSDIDNARKGLDDARGTIAERDSVIARMSIDARGLRQRLSAFAAGSGDKDSLAACLDRSGRLAELATEGGDLLAEGAGLLRQAAKANDERAAEVAALLAAWPSNGDSRRP